MSQKFKRLKFGYIGETYSGYHRGEEFRFVSYNEAVSDLVMSSRSSSQPYKMCISSCVSPSIFCVGGKYRLITPKYYMTLDCDTLENSVLIQRYLSTEKIDYIRVSTGTDGHYWYFCNKIGTVTKLADIMSRIPGVDQRYVQHSLENKSLHLRAFPKRGVVPRVRTMGLGLTFEVAAVINDLTAKSYKSFKKLCDWADEFREFWLKFSNRGTELSGIVPAQLAHIENTRLDDERRETVIALEPVAPVVSAPKYFSYDGYPSVQPVVRVAPIILDDGLPERVKTKEVAYSAIDSLEI